MKAFFQVFGKLSDTIDTWVTRFVFILIAGMVVVTTLQIIFRVFFTALTWSEELSRYLLVWGTFFGATMAYKRGAHITITFVVEALKPKVKKIFSILSYLLSIVFFAVVIYYGWQMIKMQVFQISPALSLPMRHVYLSIPVSLLIMIIHALAGIGKEITNLKERVN
jgi:TRAP-type C4-dicarboxylate transport system permease small subunit